MKKIRIKVFIPVLNIVERLDIEYPEDFRQREIDDLVESKIKDYLYNAISFTITETPYE